MAAPDDDGSGGYVAFNADACEAERRVLADRPERPAVDAVNGMVVNAAAFGTVPGGAEAAGRVSTWVDRTRTEMGRVVSEVTDLEAGTATMRDLCHEGNARTTATARTGTPG